MNISQNVLGFSIVPQTIQNLYVSNNGSDSNSGTLEAPLKTLNRAQALMSGSTTLYLNCGHTFNESINFNHKNNINITYYGVGERPKIAAQKVGIYIEESNDIAIIGIELVGTDPAVTSDAGIWINGCDRVLIEDCRISNFRNQILDQSNDHTTLDIVIRRNIIIDSIPFKNPAADYLSHSQGVYFYNRDGILLEENILDNNGKPATVFNHNCYINAMNKNVVVRANIFSRASSHGLQQRAGGTLKFNLFYMNPLGFSYGLVKGAGPVVKGGITEGNIYRNAILRGSNIDGSKRGMGCQISNIRYAEMVENIFATDDQWDNSAVIFEICDGNFGKDAYGVENFALKGNIVYKWHDYSLEIHEKLKSTNSGNLKINNVVLTRNYFPTINSKNKVTVETEVTNPQFDNPKIAEVDYLPLIEKCRNRKLGEWSIEYDPKTTVARILNGFNIQEAIPVPIPVPPITNPVPTPPLHTSLVRVEVIDTNTQKSIGELMNGAKFPVGIPINLNVILDDKSKSVKININGIETSQTDPPLSVFGDKTGKFLPWLPQKGKYTLVLTPYTDVSLKGSAGPSITYIFYGV